MQTRPLPLRVAVVQMHAHLAVEAPGHVFLGEPLGETSNTPILGRLHTRLPPDSHLLPDLERLQRSIAAAYARGLLARLRRILEFCAQHGAHLVVFPEYSVPGVLVPPLREYLTDFPDMAVVAGTHHVTDDLLLDPLYCRSFGEPLPPVNHAIAPILIPGTSVSFQLKLWRSQWEPFLALGKVPEHFTHRDVSFGVAICIDFLRHRDGDSAEIHQQWTTTDQLIVVTSATPGDSPRAFEASARDLFQHFQIPVAFANHASDGGSSIFAFGKTGEPLAADTTLPPLPATHEGVCILELQLHQPAKSKPTHLPQSQRSCRLHQPPTTNQRGENHHRDMFIPISHDLAGASTDEFDIQLEDAVPPEGPANAGPPREVLVVVPDGVGYALDRHSYPGALSLRIFVEATR